MTVCRQVRRVALALLVAIVAAGALVQAQQPQKPFKPEVGQPGKDVVWVPTSEALVEKMLELAKVTKDDFVIDLGSGDGRTVIAAAKRGARALGIEFNPDMVALSRENAASQGVSDRARFVQADLFESDFSQATVITMFLLPSINLKLRPKILDLRPGTRVVSNSFTMEEWEADETATITEGCESWCTALLWIVPAKVDGTWQLADGTITVTQQFQHFSGTLTTGGAAHTIADGKLRGNELSFTAGGARYSGRVSGNTIEGTVATGGTSRKFTAVRVNSR